MISAGRRRAGAFLLAAALVPSSAALAADEFLALMRKAEGRQEPEERVEYFTRAIQAWAAPHSRELLANCLFQRGQARYDLSDFAGALPDLDLAVKDDPRNARAYFLRGSIRLHEALAAIAAAASGSWRPLDACAARAAEAPGLAALAAKDLAENAGLRPKDLSGLLALGRAQALAGRPDDALRAFSRAGRLAASGPGPKLGAARVFMIRANWARARQLLTEADALAKGHDGGILSERAACRREQGDGPGALADYDRGIALLEEGLAKLARAPAQPAQAAERRAAAARAYFGRGSLLESRGAKDDALSDYEAGCRLGHEGCCRGVKDLATARPLEAAPRPAGEKPRKIRPNPKSSPGDRIYAN